MTTINLAAFAFTTSTPDTRPAFARAGGSWRVAHADRTADAIRDADPVLFDDVYCTYASDHGDHLRLWLGFVDNADPYDHAARLRELARRIARDGVSVRPARDRGDRIVGLYLVDAQPRRA